MDIDTCSETLQTSVKEDEELCSILEDDLTGKGHGFGEEDFVHGGSESV